LSLSIIFSQRFVLLFSVGNYIVALARLPMRVSEALGECKSTITRLFGEYNFQFYVIIQSTLFFTVRFGKEISNTNLSPWSFKSVKREMEEKTPKTGRDSRETSQEYEKTRTRKF